MSYKDTVNNKYFEWMYGIACNRRFPRSISYRKLFMHLHNIEFRYYLPKDSDRYNDGLDLRYRFAYRHPDVGDAERYIEGPCSVLEMIFALSIRIEEQIMDDPNMGDRTAQWLWYMLTNMGLGSMSDDEFDRDYVNDIVNTFLERDYQPNGKGGLFTIRDCDKDLRDVEIWWQMCWFLGSITDY